MELTRETVGRAADGDPVAVRALVTTLAPVVRVAVARVLYRHRRATRDPKQEIEDIAQETFAQLFEDGARVLRSWDAARGASLPTFVKLVAERTACSILRSGRRSPWKEEPVLAEELDRAAGATESAEAAIGTREETERLFARLREELTPRGWILFERLVLQEEPVPTLCADLGMQPDAVYAWKSRFGKLVRKLALELASDPAGSPRRGSVAGDPA